MFEGGVMVMQRGNTNTDDPAFDGHCEICEQDIPTTLDPYTILAHANRHKETHEVRVSVIIHGRKWLPEEVAKLRQEAEEDAPRRRIKG
jgi:hypothetical protein